MNSPSKIVSLPEAVAQLQAWQAAGEQIVFTNGCFDILHIGHVDYLEKARNLGSRLVVGLNTDVSIRQIKGNDRPIVNEYPRARVMAALGFVDLVVLFNEDTPLRLIESLKPDILVKGDDYTIDNIVGANFVMAHGGRVETISLVEGFSTSTIIRKIKQNNSL